MLNLVRSFANQMAESFKNGLLRYSSWFRSLVLIKSQGKGIVSDLSTWPVEYPMRTKLPQAVRVRAVASAVLR